MMKGISHICALAQFDECQDKQSEANGHKFTHAEIRHLVFVAQ